MAIAMAERSQVGKQYIEELRTRFGNSIWEESWQAADQVTITVPLNSLPDVVESIYYQQGGWLASVAVNPGPIALTLIPAGPKAQAMAWVSV